MSNVVEICNLALSHLGDSATIASIDPPEGSAQAEHCARFYPIARDSMLEMHPWRFATKRATLANLSIDSWNWTYAYAEPNNCIRVLSVLNSTDSSAAMSVDYESQSGNDGEKLIYTDAENATALYIARLTDPSRFPPLFVDALSRLLASYLAGPVIKGDAGAGVAKDMYASFMAVYVHAVNSDASQRSGTPEHTPGWIEAR
jgi:hypothetical protein